MRRITLDGRRLPVVGRVMRELVRDLDFEAVGGLTLGADPVATAMLHARADGQVLDAFVVRKEGKAHGLQRRIEGARSRAAGCSPSRTRARPAAPPSRPSGAARTPAPRSSRSPCRRPDTGAAERVEEAGLEYRFAIGKDELGLSRADDLLAATAAARGHRPPPTARPTGVAGWAVDLMEQLGGPGAGIAIAAENLFPPIPSEIILPFAGFTASQELASRIAEAIFWTTAGSVVARS